MCLLSAAVILISTTTAAYSPKLQALNCTPSTKLSLNKPSLILSLKTYTFRSQHGFPKVTNIFFFSSVSEDFINKKSSNNKKHKDWPQIKENSRWWASSNNSPLGSFDWNVELWNNCMKKKTATYSANV